MERLMSFNRFTWPSTGPLLHDSLNAAATADSSSRRPFAKFFNSLTPDCSALVNQSVSGWLSSLRIIRTNSDATSHVFARHGSSERRRSHSFGSAFCSKALSSDLGFGGLTNSNDNFRADGIVGGGGFTSPVR